MSWGIFDRKHQAIIVTIKSVRVRNNQPSTTTSLIAYANIYCSGLLLQLHILGTEYVVHEVGRPVKTYIILSNDLP